MSNSASVVQKLEGNSCFNKHNIYELIKPTFYIFIEHIPLNILSDGGKINGNSFLITGWTAPGSSKLKQAFPGAMD